MTSRSEPGGFDDARELLDAVSPAATPAEQSPDMTVTRFRSPDTDLHGLGEALSRWYTAQKLESDVSTVPAGVSVRCRSQSGSALLGVARGLTVVLRQDGADIAVEIGAAKWSDKAWVAGAGVVLMSTGIGLIPLATSAFGAYRQWRLPDQTLEFLRATAPTFERRRRGGTATGTSAPKPTPPEPRHSRADTSVVDVNAADTATLAAVPGLDATTAGRLVAARDRLGGFRSWEQVRDILSGSLPPHRLAMARDGLTVSAPRAGDRQKPAEGRGPLDL